MGAPKALMTQFDALQHWCDLWRRIGAQTAPKPLFEEIAAAYSEPHRAYHTLEHLQDCLTQLESARSLAQSPDAVALALYFHDAVYNPRASDNEVRSAALAVQRLQGGQVCQTMIEAVSRLILATQHSTIAHPSVVIDEDTALLVDIDLTILGSPVTNFDRYEANIHHEYRWVPEPLYRAKRAALLEQFLERSRLFQTDFFYCQYEQQARQNLQRSIQKLRGEG